MRTCETLKSRSCAETFHLIVFSWCKNKATINKTCWVDSPISRVTITPSRLICCVSLDHIIAVLVHGGVWPVQAEWNSESLRGWTAVFLRRARGKCSHSHVLLPPPPPPPPFYWPGSRSVWPAPLSTLCLTSQSTSRSTRRRRRCSRTRTRPTSPFTLCLRTLRMQRSSWGIFSLLYVESCQGTNIWAVFTQEGF